jgi:hypothetical protein
VQGGSIAVSVVAVGKMRHAVIVFIARLLSFGAIAAAVIISRWYGIQSCSNNT